MLQPSPVCYLSQLGFGFRVKVRVRVVARVKQRHWLRCEGGGGIVIWVRLVQFWVRVWVVYLSVRS